MADERKSDPKKGRLDRADRDAKRKRDKRGGYKNLDRQYEQLFAELPEPQQVAARLLFEFSEDRSLPSGSLTPLHALDDEIPEHTTQPIRGDRLTYGEVLVEISETVKGAKAFARNANARARRREGLATHFDRQIVDAVEGLGEEGLRQWLSYRWPADDAKARFSRVMDQYNKALQRLTTLKRENADKQARHREVNIDRVRAAEKQKTKVRREREKQARLNAPFVAIDAEGLDLGHPFEVEVGDESLSLDLGLPEAAVDRTLTCQDHRTFLWGASGDGGEPKWLGGNDKTPLRGKTICEWLLTLPKEFPGAIFVMFSAGYDWTQIFRDMNYDNAWELWNGLPWSEHEAPSGMRPNRRRWVLWGEYGLRLYPGKYLELGKFRNPEKIKTEKGKWPAAGLMDTRKRCFMQPEACYAEA